MESASGFSVHEATQVTLDIKRQMLDIWVDVSEAGGWVGFVPPIDKNEVNRALEAAIQRVNDKVDWLVLLTRDDNKEVVGFAFVADNDRLLSRHWRWVLRVQVHPKYQGIGLGVRLLDCAAELSKTRGLEVLHLTVRGGEGLEQFYAKAKFFEVAKIPGAIRVSDGDDRDQVILARQL